MQYRVAEIKETADELAARLEHKNFYAEKIAGLKPESRRLREILAVRCLLKEMTGEEQEVSYDEEGKPSLVNTETARFISISHTEGYAAVILSEKPVGIDIERRGKKVEKVISRFMQDSEIVLANNSALFSHLIWSAKEAAYKVLGKEYFDLQNLTLVNEIDFEKEIITMIVKGFDMPLAIHFKYTEDYVICYLTLD